VAEQPQQPQPGQQSRLKRWATAFNKFVEGLPGPSGLWGCVAALVLVVLTAALVRLLKTSYPRSSKLVNDPSALIGTFVTLYGLLIGAFGVLAGFLVSKKVRKPSIWAALKSFALTLLAAATVADLVLVLNAANDLYTATTHGLSYPTLHDTDTDFQIYFSLNLLAGGASVVIAALLAGSDTGPQVASADDDHQDAAKAEDSPD
jgi:hypothetical protein